MSTSPALYVGWTTTETADQARALAEALVARQLAVCIQVEGPMQSHYSWEGSAEWATEYRLWVKFLPQTANAIERFLNEHHPYQVPQWIYVAATDVGGKYLSWATQTRTN